MLTLTDKLIRTVTACVLVAVTVTALVVGYRLVKMQFAVEVYQARLREMAANYDELQSTYNRAVRKTAVTELVVKGNSLCVNIRTAEGVERTIETPFDPRHEIFVDYVVRDGRLWIRRIYDDMTRPSDGLVIDSKYADVDWSDPALGEGKVVYSSLTDGRWVVTVTGQGALGLAKVKGETPELVGPPVVSDYPEIEKQVREEVDAVGVSDVIKRITGGK